MRKTLKNILTFIGAFLLLTLLVVNEFVKIPVWLILILMAAGMTMVALGCLLKIEKPDKPGKHKENKNGNK